MTAHEFRGFGSPRPRTHSSATNPLLTHGRRFEIDTDPEPIPRQAQGKVNVLFLVEGFVDVRLLRVLCQVANLTLITPMVPFYSSQLNLRIRRSGLAIPVHIIPGDRLEFQWRSLKILLKISYKSDLILAQENLRGAINANIAGRIHGKPVLTYTAIPAQAYYRCRRRRGQISRSKEYLGLIVISFMEWMNSRLSQGCLAVGPYLSSQKSNQFRSVILSQAYGVDTTFFCPVNPQRKRSLRLFHNLPGDGFIAFFSSRISHEKDAETFLLAVAMLRQSGMPAYALNCSGERNEFIQLARSLNLPDWETWVLARPAYDPTVNLNQIYQAVDAVAQTSLEEGLGLSPLEALACGIPTIVTAVGGMKHHMRDFARHISVQDPQALARELQWVHDYPTAARSMALRGREYVQNNWSSDMASGTFHRAFKELLKPE